MLRLDQLSQRQRQILDGVATGKSNAVIAEEIGITLDGVKWHVSELLGEAGFASRGELAEWWRHETSPRVAPAFLPRRILSHPVAGAVARIAVVFAVAAAIAAGIVIVATRGKHTALVVVPVAREKLAYVQDGDIWLKTLPDGVTQQITHHTGDQDTYSRPRWSPSGQWLSFLVGKQPGAIRGDGSDMRLFDLDPGALVWSPTSDRLAYTTKDGALAVENADGSGQTVLARSHTASGENGGLSNLVWSGDGLSIAYVEERAVSGTPQRTYTGIWSVAADGSGQPEELLSERVPPQDGFGLLAWARLALLFYRTPSFTADVSDGVTVEALGVGSGPQPTVHKFAPGELEMLTATELWSIDSSGKLGAMTVGLGRDTWTGKRIAIVSPIDATFVGLTDRGVAAIEPSWSPDGQRVAYVAAPDASVIQSQSSTGIEADRKAALARRKIWVMDAYSGGQYGANQRQLTDDPAYRDEYPRWSADGSHIYFMRLDQQDRWSLWVMTADGENAQQLIDNLSPNILGSTAPVWFGYYGLIGWSGVLDYWPGTAP